MADVTPDWHVAQQKFRFEISQQQAKIEQYKWEIMQMDSQRKRTVDNAKASQRAIEEAEEKLAGLIDEHGEATVPAID